MKQITELTEQEILALTDDQLSKMVQYKMAEAGIKILSMPDQPVYETIPAKDVTAYSVNGLNNYFLDKEVAEKVGSFLRGITPNMVKTNYRKDYNRRWVSGYEESDYSFINIGNVTTEAFYNPQTCVGLESIDEKNKAAKDTYEAALDEYNAADEASADIKVMIYGRYNEVRKKYERMAEMQYHYQRYLKLADGNETIAMNFLKAAYSIDEQTEYYVQGKEMPETVTEEEYHTTAKSEGCAN